MAAINRSTRKRATLTTIATINEALEVGLSFAAPTSPGLTKKIEKPRRQKIENIKVIKTKRLGTLKEPEKVEKREGEEVILIID